MRIPWDGSTRRDTLPPNWSQLRRRILKRDGYRCTWREAGRRCREDAKEVDHRVPGDDHRESNLQSLCVRHHSRKSALEGQHAMRAKRAEIHARYRLDE